MMHIVAIVAFYGAMVFGIGGGVVALFRAGRIGLRHLAAWRRAAPLSPPSDLDEMAAWLGLTGFPTSARDLLLALTPIGWIAAWWDLLRATMRMRGQSLAYGASLLGPFVAQVWLGLGVPLLLLEIVLEFDGTSYAPGWMPPHSPGIHISLLAVGVIFILAYLIGSLVGSLQKSFGRACTLYEDVVVCEGYWFDRSKKNPQSPLDASSLKQLEKALAITRSIHGAVSALGRDKEDDLVNQRLMSIYYQQGLILCALGQLNEAAGALHHAAALCETLVGSDLMEPNECDVMMSQILFLKGEIALVQGRTIDAQRDLRAARGIDSRLNDLDGLSKIDARLALLG